jgi:hypothetical protein
MNSRVLSGCRRSTRDDSGIELAPRDSGHATTSSHLISLLFSPQLGAGGRATENKTREVSARGRSDKYKEAVYIELAA